MKRRKVCPFDGKPCPHQAGCEVVHFDVEWKKRPFIVVVVFLLQISTRYILYCERFNISTLRVNQVSLHFGCVKA